MSTNQQVRISDHFRVVVRWFGLYVMHLTQNIPFSIAETEPEASTSTGERGKSSKGGKKKDSPPGEGEVTAQLMMDFFEWFGMHSLLIGVEINKNIPF